VGEIASSAQEQNQGIGEIASAVSQMDTVVQNNAAGAEETASAAEELNAQAFELNEVVHDLGTMVDGTHRRVATEPSEVAPKATPVVKKSIVKKVLANRSLASAPEADFFSPVAEESTAGKS